MEGGGTKFVCAVGSGPDDLQEEIRFPTTTPEETLTRAVDFFKRYQPAAIGVASFGPVDLHPQSPTYGYITATPKPGWSHTDVLGAFKREFNCPLVFETDVNAAAFGEFTWIKANRALESLVYFTIEKTPPMKDMGRGMSSHFEAWIMHLKSPSLRASFAIGFCILFAFIGTFTYVNFVLVREPLSLGSMELGLVYFVFLPSIVTTPFAGAAVRRYGTRPTFWTALALAGLGLPLLLQPNLKSVIVGLMLVGVGTFFAQAAATGFVGRAATADRGSASGIYLGCYFLGGLIGTAVLGQIFDRLGWGSCVAGIALALVTAALLAVGLRLQFDKVR